MRRIFWGTADLTTLPQVVTTPSSVGVVSSFAKLLFQMVFGMTAAPVVAARGSVVIWEVRQIIAASHPQVVPFPLINSF